MKTKFFPILKIKKIEIDKVMDEINKLSSVISQEETKLNSLKEELKNTTYPSSGNFSLIVQIREIIKYLNFEINSQEIKLHSLYQQKKQLQEKLKQANLEYEKIKYIHNEEIKKMLKEKKSKEAKNLDEIANILFNNKKVI